MGKIRTAERIQAQRKLLTEAAQEKAMKASLKEYSEVMKAVELVRGGLRTIAAKRAFHTLQLYAVQRKPWKDSKSLAAGLYSISPTSRT